MMYDHILLPLTEKAEGMENDFVFLYQGQGDIMDPQSYDLFSRDHIMEMYKAMRYNLDQIEKMEGDIENED